MYSEFLGKTFHSPAEIFTVYLYEKPEANRAADYGTKLIAAGEFICQPTLKSSNRFPLSCCFN